MQGEGANISTAIPSPWLVAADLFNPPPIGVSPYVPHPPHPPQQEFLDLECLDALFGGAAGPGKSWALLAAALQYVHVPRYAAILFRRTYEDLKLPGALISRSKEWLYGTDARWNENAHRWTFPSGATLSFGYLQHPEDHFRYQGAEFQYIGVDEAGQLRENQLRYMFSRLRRPDNVETGDALGKVPLRMRLASNPGGRSHEYMKRRYVQRLPDPEDPEDTAERAEARVFVPARLQDNPSVDQKAYRESLAALDPAERAQLLDGDWDARGLGDWFFPDLSGVIELGQRYEEDLQAGELVPPSGGVLHLGIDWGQSSSAVLLWPLEGGGFFVAREFNSYAEEPGVKTHKMLALREQVGAEHIPWGRAFFDAAGVQSQATFNATAERVLGYSRPSAKSIPFGAQAPRTARTARKSFKGVGCTYLRRMAARATDGQRTQVLAISFRCPVLLRQMKMLRNDPEDAVGAWLKEEDQHACDALVAGVTLAANQFRVAVEEAKQNGANGKARVG